MAKAEAPVKSLMRRRSGPNGKTARGRKFYIEQPPTLEHEQNELADELIRWASENDTHIINEFPVIKRMAPNKMWSIGEVNPYFSDAIKFTKAIISNRLQRGWLENTLCEKYCQKWLAIYDDAVRALQIERYTAATENMKGSGQFTVLLEKSPDDPSVPMRIG